MERHCCQKLLTHAYAASTVHCWVTSAYYSKMLILYTIGGPPSDVLGGPYLTTSNEGVYHTLHHSTSQLNTVLTQNATLYVLQSVTWPRAYYMQCYKSKHTYMHIKITEIHSSICLPTWGRKLKLSDYVSLRFNLRLSIQRGAGNVHFSRHPLRLHNHGSRWNGAGNTWHSSCLNFSTINWVQNDKAHAKYYTTT